MAYALDIIQILQDTGNNHPTHYVVIRSWSMLWRKGLSIHLKIKNVLLARWQMTRRCGQCGKACHQCWLLGGSRQNRYGESEQAILGKRVWMAVVIPKMNSNYTMGNKILVVVARMQWMNKDMGWLVLGCGWWVGRQWAKRDVLFKLVKYLIFITSSAVVRDLRKRQQIEGKTRHRALLSLV